MEQLLHRGVAKIVSRGRKSYAVILLPPIVVAVLGDRGKWLYPTVGRVVQTRWAVTR
jgi:hypothetical protein